MIWCKDYEMFKEIYGQGKTEEDCKVGYEYYLDMTNSIREFCEPVTNHQKHQTGRVG